jgi:hypothetical protein
MDLPHDPLVCHPLVNSDLDEPYPTVIDQLIGYLDAAHGTCVRTRRSMGDVRWGLLHCRYGDYLPCQVGCLHLYKLHGGGICCMCARR